MAHLQTCGALNSSSANANTWQAQRFPLRNMSATNFLNLEAIAFLYALAFIVGYRLLTGRIRLKGLFVSKAGPHAVRAERVQLLLTTIAFSVKYLGDVTHSSNGDFPTLDRGWYYVFGSSSGIYLARKAYERYLKSQPNQ